MAKTIKFNLKLDEYSVRDIKGLQDNFCINDILEVYENGLLLKWLKVRGYDEYLEKVNKIDDKKSIVIQLINIFDISKDESEIKEAIYLLEFEEQRKKEIDKFKQNNDDLVKVIDSYHKTYEELINSILEHKENMPFLKTVSKEISDKYLKLFELDYKALYYMLKDKAPLMIYAILMNDKLSFWFMKDETIKQDLYGNFVFINIVQKYQKDTNYEWMEVCNQPIEILSIYEPTNWLYVDEIKHNNHEESKFTKENAIGRKFSKLYFSSYSSRSYVEYIKLSDKNNFEFYQGATDGYWKDLETEDTKVMILSIPSGTFITTPDNPKKEYSEEEINGNFLILDGLLYKSNTDNESIVYMKV